MVIDKIRKMSIKGVKLKSESFFSISYGVLELWRKNLRGADSAPPGPDRVNLQTFNISNCNVTISAPAQPDTKKPRYDAFEIDPDLDFSLFSELLN